MSVDHKRSIVYTEIFCSGDFYLDHPVLLSGRCPRHVNIHVRIFNIQNNKLREALSASQTSELIVPVFDGIDFVSLHGVHIDDMDRGGDLVDQDQGADATKSLLEFRG